MTHYATCIGCAVEGDCGHREALRENLHGLGVTSVKWRCKHRADRFQRGAPVWVVTVADLKNPTYDEDSREYGRGTGPERNTFPAIFIRAKGPSALVFIHPGAQSQCDEATFSGGPICRIPLSRISAREGEIERVCRHCDMPASAPHREGYPCNLLGVTP